MNRGTPRRLTAVAAATGAFVLAFAGTAPTAAATDGLPDLPDLTELVDLSAAELLADTLETAADRAGLTVDTVRELVESGRAVVGASGVLSYTDEFEAPADGPGAADPVAPAADVPGDPAVGSRPGAPYTVYLDFDGATIRNTEWNRYYDQDVFELAPNAAATDAAYVYQVWARVAEDYAPFDVNVTTTDPGADALHKTSPDDGEYGMTAVVTDTTDIEPAADAGGRAWAGGFGNAFLSPAMIFAPVARDSNAPDVGNIVSHEVGHTFGLNHDGIGDDEYYGDTQAEPDSLWGPIMGAPWSAPLSQWSPGDYAGATHSGEDDLAEITATGTVLQTFMVYDGDQMWPDPYCTDADDPDSPQPGDSVYKPNGQGTCDPAGDPLTLEFHYADRAAYAADDHGGVLDEASALDTTGGDFTATGVIERSGERDVFTFVTGGGPVTVAAEGASVGQNLDLRLELIDGAGELVSEADPESGTDPASPPADRTANGLNAQLEAEVGAGVYHVRVSGTGQGDPAANTPAHGSGYTAYGSLGHYTVSGTAAEFDAAPVTIISPEDGDEVQPAPVEITGSAEPGSTVALTVGDQAAGEGTTDDEGTWSIVLSTDLPLGESTVTAQQTVGDVVVPETASVTVVVPVGPPTIVRPVDGDTATTATPTFSGEGVPGAAVELGITCGEDAWAGGTEVDGEGAWAFTPGQELPNGECSVSAVQAINGTTSAPTDSLTFTVDVATGDDGAAGDDDGSDDGAEDGGDDGLHLPDTGASAHRLVLLAGVVLLGLGAALYARTRRGVTG
ncbi:LPXTG cell wall anchor domain-containing protein [Jiangella ureilytica]|uniref:LPXTG cell wall anchor domain-containing protein n=1 Tax=Jiangella ureilytica TaxID=2530374 RepID=A0A4R4RCY0_9ACTN|nr:Ig-like domain-containing protein [Jiangella ureilytica]TDC47004.1 LPXTG cell wall anchor domain-containing protein [Jiangella ureilytica]